MAKGILVGESLRFGGCGLGEKIGGDDDDDDDGEEDE